MIRKFDKLEPAIRSMKREYKKERGYSLNIGKFDHAVLEHCITTKTCAHFKVTPQGAILVFWTKDLPCGGEQLEVVYKFNRFYDKSGPFCLQTRGYQSCHILSGNIESTEADIAKTIAKLIKQGERVAKALNLKTSGFPETMMDTIPTNKGV
jgi:hypothetical protein